MIFLFGEKTGFAALASGDVELMYQSVAMSSAQEPKAIERVERTIVYLEVSSLVEIEARLGDAEGCAQKAGYDPTSLIMQIR